MSDSLYLHQSRRLAKILRQYVGNSSWTNYTGWEYHLRNGIRFEITYTRYSGVKRFKAVTYSPEFKVLLSTNSLKECISFLRKVM